MSAAARPVSREVYAAAHVVVDPRCEPPDQVIDWDATLAFRHHLWALGLGVADAMDTAQRGGGLGWPQARELIARSGAEARAVGGALVCGASTDQLDPAGEYTTDELVAAYLEQVEWIERHGGVPVLMASRLLTRAAAGPEDYLDVYDRVISQAAGPVVLHWLGTAFDPLLEGYWGSSDLDVAARTVLQIIGARPEKVAGIKISLLDAGREIALRRQLPAGVKMFTGDDFNYEELIRGDEEGFSHALLGAFDPLAGPARAALARLDDGDEAGFRAILEPTVPFARHLFRAPTSAYKTGVVFVAWLAGHQSHFHLLGGAQIARSTGHLVRLYELAAEAGALPDAELAAHRMRAFRVVAGLDT